MPFSSKPFLFLILTMLLMPPNSYAAKITQKVLDDPSKNHHGIAVNPSIQVLKVKPGSASKALLYLANYDSKPFTVSLFALRGTGSEDPNSLVAISPSGKIDPSKDASAWVTLPQESFVLKAHSSAAIPIKIQVPFDARAGDHTTLATFTIPTTKPSSDSKSPGVSGSGGVASTLIIKVPGDARSSMQVSSMKTPRIVMPNTKNYFHIRVKNTGDTMLLIDARIQLKRPIIGGGRTLDTDQQRTLPEGVREFKIKYEDPPLIGWYKPQVTVVGGEGTGLRTTKSLPFVLVLPPWWLTVLLIIAIAFPIAIYRRKR